MKAKAVIAAPILLIIVFLLTWSVSLIPPETLGLDTDPLLSSAIIQLLIIALPAVIFCRLRGKGYMSKLRLRGIRASHIAFMIFSLGFLFFGSSGINYLMYTLFQTASSDFSSAAAPYSGISGGLYLVFAAAVVPAITEEFLFRGIIIAEYEEVGVPAAILMSSLTFAMLHSSFARLPSYIFCGLVLTMVLYTTRSVTAAMIVHMANNTLSVFFGDFVYKVVSRQGIALFCFTLAALIFLFAILMFGESERIYAGYAAARADSSYAEKIKKGHALSGIVQSIVSPPFTALAVLYIIITAVK